MTIHIQTKESMSESPHSASNSIIVRLKLSNEVGVLARITNTISEMGGNIGAIDLVRPEAGFRAWRA